MPNIVEAYMQRLAELSESANEAASDLRKVFLWLKTRNPKLDRIEISYDGCGGSGQVEDIQCWATNPTAPSTLERVELDGMDEPLPDEFFNAKPRKQRKHQTITCNLTIQSRESRNCTPEQLLDKLAWDLAYGENPGFEINEGGYGTVRIRVSTDNPDGVTVTLSHSERIIETNDYDYEF